MRKTPYEIGGFAFSDKNMLEKAAKEAEGIRYVKNGTDMHDPDMVLLVYRQMVEQQIFETPVGYAFLYELQEYLKTIPAVSSQDIPAIPVITNTTEQTKSVPKTNKKEEVKTKVKTVRKIKEQNIDYKVWFRTTFSVSVILLLIVIGMFAVTATSDNINIVNYENAIIEKYEDWESRLKEKEEQLKERETALREAEAANEENVE